MKWEDMKVVLRVLLSYPSSSAERNSALCQRILLPLLLVELLFLDGRGEQEQGAYLMNPIHFPPHHLGKACTWLTKDHTRKFNKNGGLCKRGTYRG